MDEPRKNAYRMLLYWAMLDIRPIQCVADRWYRLINPFSWRGAVREVVKAGAIADWLHNLASYSSLDFEGFDESLFWEEFQDKAKRLPELIAYRNRFDENLRALEMRSE